MIFSPATIDRIVAEVTRRLAATDARGVSRAGVIDLSDQKVLTGELIEAQCAAGAAVAIDPKAIQTPTARDAIRRLDLVIQTVDALREPTDASVRLLAVQSDPAALQLGKRLRWNPELVDTAAAVERGRSIICRGEAAAVVVMTSSPHKVAAELNRRDRIWAAAVSDADGIASIAGQFNIACLHVQPATSFRLVEPLRRFVAQAGEIA